MKVSPNMTSTSVANSDRRALGWAGFFLSILLIGGCSALPDKPVRPAVYDFGPGLVPKATPAAGAALPPLLLADIEAPAAVDGTAVLYRLAYADVQQVRPYAQARWSMSPAQLVRQRLRDPLSQQRVVLNPAEGPAGWILRLCVNEAHRDPSVFEDPDRFDPARFRDRAWSRNEYSPFGGHTHGCMGAHLAHFLGRIFVEELAIGFDWTVVRDGPLERGSRHRDHWRPRDDALRPQAPVEAIGTA